MIVSTTLTGSNSEIILDALYSVTNSVDFHIIIDTGATDNTIQIVQNSFPDKAIILKYTWDNDFSAARNFALKAANDAGASWAITVDTDERIEWNGDDLRKFLESNQDVETVSILDRSGTYGKERIFKIPAAQRFHGPTHECYLGYLTKCAKLQNARFWEVPKSNEGYHKKFLRDIGILEKHTKENPEDPRWWYYLGESYKNTNQHELAVDSYGKCFSLNGWDEESAWACFRMAECLCQMGQFAHAKDVAIDGLKRHPGCSELHWIAGWSLYQIGRFDHALCHAKYSIAGVDFKNEVNRIGFRHIPALNDAPFDLARWCYRRLGNEAMFLKYSKLMEVRVNPDSHDQELIPSL